MSSRSICVAGCLLLAGVGLPAFSQISLTTAVDLAEKTDPRVRIAQADLEHAKAALAEAHDAFVPSIGATGGVGRSTGVPLSLPVVFSIAAQSLVFNFSQLDNIRSAHAGVDAAKLTLQDMQEQVAEDTVETYLALDEAQQRHTALNAAAGFSTRLVDIVQGRFDAGLDPHVDLTRAKRTTAQLHLQTLQSDDEIETLQDHLGRLTGIRAALATEHDSIPGISLTRSGNVTVTVPESPRLRAARANVAIKEYLAHGQKRYAYLPQFAFAANYSRISTAFTNYAAYYPAFNPANRLNMDTLSNNALSLGVQLSIPLFDRAQKARYQEGLADAARARAEADDAGNAFREGELKLRHGMAELAARSELAEQDQQLAQDQLDAVLVQLQSSAAALQGPLLTPKDEQNARLQERQRYVDVLAAKLERDQTAVKLMRQDGMLESWLRSSLHATPGTTSVTSPAAPATH